MLAKSPFGRPRQVYGEELLAVLAVLAAFAAELCWQSWPCAGLHSTLRRGHGFCDGFLPPTQRNLGFPASDSAPMILNCC